MRLVLLVVWAVVPLGACTGRGILPYETDTSHIGHKTDVKPGKMLRRAKAYTARNKRSASTSDLYTEKCLNNKKRALQEQERDQKTLAGHRGCVESK